MRTNVLILAGLIATAPIAFGQVTIGSNLTNADFGTSGNFPITLIDLGRPAVASGSVNTFTIRWSGDADCGAAFKVKIIRGNLFSSSYTTVAERGPFAAKAGVSFVTVTLSPPVSIKAGDFLGVTQLKSCGGVRQGP